MNWTEGRLRRHGRSHESGQVRAQRNHFARVRGQRRKQWDARADSNLILSAVDREHLGSGRGASPAVRPSSQHALAHNLGNDFKKRGKAENYHNDSRGDSVDLLMTRFSTQDRRTIQSNTQTTNRRLDNADKTKLKEVMPTSMTELKQKLLAQPDWLGLSTHRPVKINFSLNSIANTGRHRRIKRLNEVIVNKPPPDGVGKQRQIVGTALRKRKRSDYEESSCSIVHHDGDEFQRKSSQHASSIVLPTSSNVRRGQFDNTAETRAYSPQPNLLLNDDNRQHYSLRNHDSSLEADTEYLLPLNEIRAFSTFDAVKARQAQLGKHASIKVGRTPCKTVESTSQLLRENRTEQQLPNILRPLHETSKSTLDDSVEMELEHSRPGFGRQSSTPNVRHLYQHELVNSVNPLCGKDALQVESSSPQCERDPGTIVKDFATWDLTERAMHHVHTAAAQKSAVRDRLFRLNTPSLDIPEMPPIFQTNALSADVNLHDRFSQRQCYAGLHATSHPPKRLQLGPEFSSNDCNVSGAAGEASGSHDRPRAVSDHIEHSSSVPLSYFSHTTCLDARIHGKEGKTSIPQRSSSDSSYWTRDRVTHVTGLPESSSRHERRERSSSLNSHSRSKYSEASQPHELVERKEDDPEAEQVRRQAWLRYDGFGLNGSSSPRTQGPSISVPFTMISTPPRRHERSDPYGEDISPYFQGTRLGCT